MTRRILERLLASLGVVLGAVTLIFLVLHWLPGDAATLIAGEGASAETVAQLRAQIGDDQPLLARYVAYLADVLRGDLGQSYLTREPVLARLRAQFPATLQLALFAGALALAIGVALGVLSARYRDTWIDGLIQLVSLTVVSVPVFWLGILAILLFSVQLGWLPVLSDGGPASLVLPVGCLGLWVSVPLLRVVRGGMLEGLSEPYVTTLRAKGLGERRVFFVHVLRNALIAGVTLLSVQVGELLSGLVIVETLFARQGVGRLAVDAIGQKDLPMVEGAILLASVTYVFVNLLVDLSYAVIDPRTRLAGAEAR
ncbi:MAG: ABC transporter permease [Polyangiales bacterium]